MAHTCLPDVGRPLQRPLGHHHPRPPTAAAEGEPPQPEPARGRGEEGGQNGVRRSRRLGIGEGAAAVADRGLEKGGNTLEVFGYSLSFGNGSKFND